jgi:importin subunit alpha-1
VKIDSKSICEFSYNHRLLHYLDEEIRRTNAIRAALVPIFVKFLLKTDHRRFQYEAAWALTNITSGTTEDTQLVIDCGAVPLLVEMLKSNHDPEYIDAAVWVLGNIMGDSPKARDLVLEYGVVPIFCDILLNKEEKRVYSPLVKTVTWAVANIYRKTPRPPLFVAELIVKPVLKALQSADVDVVKECCWTLSYISEGEFPFVELLINAGTLSVLINDVVPRFFSRSLVIRPIVRILGSVAAGTTEQTQAVLDSNPLPALLQLLDCPIPIIAKEICWTLSNITAGTEIQLYSLLESNILPKIISLTRSNNTDIRKEALWVIANILDDTTTVEKTTQVREGSISATKFDIKSDLMILKALNKCSNLPIDSETNKTFIQKSVDTLVREGML